MRSAIVLGAGMAGVCAALHLRRRQWDVVVVDRLEPGRATSYGNAGIIQSEAAEPFAMPRDLASLLAIATGRSNDVHFHWASLPRHAPALLRYWWNSAPARHRVLAQGYASLISNAIATHEELMRGTNAAGLVRREGYRVFHRGAADMAQAIAEAERVRATYGVPFKALDPRALAVAEPALKDAGAGAIHWLAPWTVSNPGALMAAYADLLAREGGRFVHGAADSLTPAAAGGWRVETADGPVEAEHAVVALGPWSPELLRRFGYAVPMVRKRGYHRHYAGAALDLPLMDADNGYVMAPMADGLRITTGAELTAPDAPLTPVQLTRAEAAARGLLDFGAGVEAEPWTGVRPCMPDMLPLVGRAPRHPGLWLDFGHGHQGFTLGPATGLLLAQMMAGERPYVDPAPFRPERWCGAARAAA
ncbi:NAD(P)/FAD-dependent oxidoreductase [Azorhizobium doebereinerae]|uniref:NAD(P)/FAD-dependent oxidoreductase n=1 Tax=Azorhizobium doebereinerae TaxID=281091 RepID=UPI00040C3F0C|nr:FAD-binding oxidoreductase [Azorhizobium doebereinerae]